MGGRGSTALPECVQKNPTPDLAQSGGGVCVLEETRKDKILLRTGGVGNGGEIIP